MQLNDLKPTWQRFKTQNGMQDLNTTEILMLIEEPNTDATHAYRLFAKAVLFLVITFFCVGG
ncbi:MAG: hypothetical protein R8G66_15020 [Cytophagales bacterium]|nr:hypothetical protein [Cytophagales bacterium]